MKRQASNLVVVLTAVGACAGVNARYCDVIRDCGAVADNKTDATASISGCALACSIIYFPTNSSFRVSSIDVSGTTNLTLQFGDSAGLYASDDSTLYPVQSALPWQGPNATQWRAIVYGRNVSGFSIVGPPTARIDGLGWPWWANFSAGTLQHQRPKLVELVDCSDILFDGMTYANSPFWTLHPTYCDGLTFRGVTVLAPRPVGNTDGIDPDSCTNVLIDSCHVDVGDDGISIKSGNYDQPPYTLLPAANITILNTTVLSRNVAIGSACFGGIYNVSMIGGRIGDDAGSSPWAIKIKTHVPFGGVVAGISFKGVTLGAIAPNSYQQPKGGTALQVLLEQYTNTAWTASDTGGSLLSSGGASVPMPQPAPTQIVNVSFVDVAVHSAVEAGTFVALPDPPYNFTLSGFTFDSVQFKNVTGKAASAWSCTGFVAGSTVAKNVVPPLPRECGL